jgi:hypothetical protein
MADEHEQFPYMRIDARRYNPVSSWDAPAYWGRDYVLEQDGRSWEFCWDAMSPILDYLDTCGVHYWLKYTGHHSLHVVIGAENFVGTALSKVSPQIQESFAERLVTFFNVLGRQPLYVSGYHSPPGTNMPFTLNEHSGLLNYPVLRIEIDGFNPEKASITQAEVRKFWREFPESYANDGGARLLAAVLSDGPVIHVPEDSRFSALLNLAESPGARDRKEAMIRLPWFIGRDEAVDRLKAGLSDKSPVVRRAAIRAMQGITCPALLKAQREVAGSQPEKLQKSIATNLGLAADIAELRAAAGA